MMSNAIPMKSLSGINVAFRLPHEGITTSISLSAKQTDFNSFLKHGDVNIKPFKEVKRY